MLPKTKTPPKKHLSDFTVLLYGKTKLGKSTWCSHAEKAVFLATEPGLNNLDVFQVPIENWEDMLKACADLARGGHPFKTVIIDTIDNAYKMCSAYTCDKHKIDHESDLGYGKGYAFVNNEFQRVITKLAFMPYGLYLVSHAQEREIENRTGGKYIKTVPTLPDKARKIALGLVDIILFADLEIEQNGEEKTVRRVVRTKPNVNYEAGDRTGRLPEVIDLDYDKFTAAFEGKATAKAGR